MTTEGTSVHGAQGPHTHGALVGVPCRPSPPVTPSMLEPRTLWHTHSSPATGQEESKWLGDTDLAPRGASSRYSGDSAAPVGLEVLSHTR